MPGPTNPQTPQTRPDANRDDTRKSGRPQDDRDPNSPTRTTQRPGQTINIDEVDPSDAAIAKRDEEDVDRNPETDDRDTAKTNQPGQPARKQ